MNQTRRFPFLSRIIIPLFAAVLAFIFTPPQSGATEPAPGAGPENIANLIAAGKVRATINGDDISRLRMRIEKTTPQPLDIIIPAGTYFVCNNPKAQNMVSTEDVRIALAESQSEADSTAIPVACANRPKDVPKGGDSFTIGSLPNGDELAKLIALLKGKNTDFAIKQAAVWIVTDNAGYNDLRTLAMSRRGIAGVYLPSSRMIQAPEAVAAMRLCAEAGIDIKRKAIWHYHAQWLHPELPAGELRDWIQTFGGFTMPTHSGSIATILITPDGKCLLTANGVGDATLWSLPEGKRIKTLERGLVYRDSVISPDGKQLITDRGGVLNLPDGSVVQKRMREGLDNWDGMRRGPIVPSPDGSLLTSVVTDYKTSNNAIKVFRFPEGTLLATLDSGADIVSARERPIAISPDGKQLAAPGAGGSLKFWSLPDGKLTMSLEKESTSLISRDWKWRVSFRSERKSTAPAGTMQLHTAIDIHSPADGERVKTLAEYPGSLRRTTAITPDGKHLLLALDKTVRLLSIPDGALLLTLPVVNADDCVLSPDGKLLLTRENDTLTARRLPDGEILGSFKVTGYIWMDKAVISPDNTVLVMDNSDPSAPGIVKLWSLPDGKLIKTLEAE